MSGHGDVIRTTRAWFEACLAAEARAAAAEKETATLRAALEGCIPWIGGPRSQSQEALVVACDLVGYDPWDWSDHEDVLRSRLAVMPRRYRRKYLRRSTEAAS